MIRPCSTSSPCSSSSEGAALTDGSRVPSPEAVGADAEVALEVDRVPAERAARAARLQHLLRALDEGPGAAGVDADEEDLVGLRLGQLLVQLLGADDGRLGVGEDLDDDPLVGGVPRERHGAG